VCVFVLPPILALVPRGAAPLAAVATLFAAGRVAADPPRGWSGLRVPAAIFGLLLLWGALSALWAIDPARSVVMEVRLVGLFAAALTLAAAARAVAAPRQIALPALAGTALAAVLACCDLATSGGLSGFVTVRPFAAPRLNQIAVWLAIMLLPFAALLVSRGRVLVGIMAAAAMGATVCLLDGTAAKTALALSLPVAALLYLRRGLVARMAAALSVVAVLTAPLTLPRLADHPLVLRDADAFKTSLGHRLYIWAFAGKRSAERPLRGWGLDSSRSIPGGSDRIRWNQTRMPLHPHDAALQVWLELGVPGAVLFAALLGRLWLGLADCRWPRLYAAAAGGSLTAAIAALSASWGIWQEWWLATLAIAAFVIVLIARAAAEPATPPPRPAPRGGGR
jgi:O-antigen ligase